VIEDFDRCYRAVQSKDPRFDGWFFMAVTSTGIYCRPSCPARPKAANIRFYPSAAAAQQAGFRACKRCRPDAVPGSPEWNNRTDVVARAMRLIADGVVDREGVPGMARQLGYSTRQLERLLQAEVGAGPAALARCQRAQSARLLIETTSLPMTALAFAAGFASIRQFNETVRAVFAASPSELRAKVVGRPSALSGGIGGAGLATGSETLGQLIQLRLPFRRPFSPDGLFGRLAATAIPGCEEIRDGSYRRTMNLPGGAAIVTLSPSSEHIACSLRLRDLRDLTTAIARCRRLLDLDADPEAVDAVLSADPALAPLVANAQGQRVPRTVDENEMALRAVLGQQISIAEARRSASRLASLIGTPISDDQGGLTHAFPTVERVAGMDPSDLAMPESRKRTLLSMAESLSSGALHLGPGADREQARAQLTELPGLSPWTVEIIAMRALGDPDAFLVGDVGIQNGAAKAGLPRGGSDLLIRADAWRPWRAYAVQYLWSSLDPPINLWSSLGTGATEQEVA
jgi:AraC family transcriptional regulator, regulatory protein of adaptative response / DNA-3-methyladenine glycosylase II